MIGSTFIADTRFFRLNYKQKKTVFIFRMRKKLFISISTLSIVFWFILTLRLAITPELRESKFSDDNFKFILIWKGFSDPPIRGREMSCPHQCYITENRLIFQTAGSTLSLSRNVEAGSLWHKDRWLPCTLHGKVLLIIGALMP